MPRSPLPLLIRQARLVVDERRAELAALARQEEEAEAALTLHDAVRDTEEAQLDQHSTDIQARYAVWLRHHKQRRETLADRHGKLVRSRNTAQDALQEVCADLKRLELAEEARQQAEKRAAARKQEAKAEDIQLILRAAGAP